MRNATKWIVKVIEKETNDLKFVMFYNTRKEARTGKSSLKLAVGPNKVVVMGKARVSPNNSFYTESGEFR